MNKYFYRSLMTVMAFSLMSCGSAGQTSDEAVDKQEEVPEETAETVNTVTEETSKEETSSTNKKENTYAEFNLNETVSNDFMEFTIFEASTTDMITPSDTSSAYTYYETEDTKKFFYIDGEIKNISADIIPPGNSLCQFIFDDKYTYNAQIVIEQDNYLSSYYGLDPFDKCRLVIFSEIPNELLDTYQTVKIKWGMTEAFSAQGGGSYEYVFNWEDCTMGYVLNLSK